MMGALRFLDGARPVLVEDRFHKVRSFTALFAQAFGEEPYLFTEIREKDPSLVAEYVAREIQGESRVVLFLDSTWTGDGEGSFEKCDYRTTDCVLFLKALSELVSLEMEIFVVLYSIREIDNSFFPDGFEPVASGTDNDEIFEELKQAMKAS